MVQRKSCGIIAYFSNITDPRMRKVTYPPANIIPVAIATVIGGANDFVGIVRFAKAKKERLGRFPVLSAGIL